MAEVAFAVVEWQGRVLAVRRKKGTLLSGLWSLPGGELEVAESFEHAAARHMRYWGVHAAGLEEVSRQRKVFSSRVWDAWVFRCQVPERGEAPDGALWLCQEELERVPFVPFHRELLAALGVPKRKR
jgi:ADP-ribose pyrophosphatase YjhB (NUDIX family)